MKERNYALLLVIKKNLKKKEEKTLLILAWNEKKNMSYSTQIQSITQLQEALHCFLIMGHIHHIICNSSDHV